MKLPATLDHRLWFPDPRTSPASGPFAGLVAIGGDFSVPRLLLAYRRGVFPWTANPITWWSPDPRAIFELDHIHVPRSLAKLLRKPVFEITIDHAFRQVMEGCAGGRREGTWITSEFIEAYTRLHEQSHAHSVECWQNQELVGGIYGVSIGGFFAGESMFHRVSSASKIALYHLIEHLRQQRFALFDVQVTTPATAQLGAITISREEYLKRLAQAVELLVSF
jgi:leucyl/phenylalanyl-tRNA--protein transferase